MIRVPMPEILRCAQHDRGRVSPVNLSNIISTSLQQSFYAIIYHKVPTKSLTELYSPKQGTACVDLFQQDYSLPGLRGGISNGFILSYCAPRTGLSRFLPRGRPAVERLYFALAARA